MKIKKVIKGLAVLGLASMALVSCESSSEDTAVVEEATFSEFNAGANGNNNLPFVPEIVLTHKREAFQRTLRRAFGLLRQRPSFGTIQFGDLTGTRRRVNGKWFVQFDFTARFTNENREL